MANFNPGPDSDPALVKLNAVIKVKKPEMDKLRDQLKAEKAERLAREIQKAKEMEEQKQAR